MYFLSGWLALVEREQGRGRAVCVLRVGSVSFGGARTRPKPFGGVVIL